MCKNKKGNINIGMAVLLVLCLCMANMTNISADNSHLQNTVQTVRVLLRRLNITTRIDIMVRGNYSIESAFGTAVLTKGSKVIVQLQEGQLYVYAQGAHWKGGEKVTFIRHSQNEGGENGLGLNDGPNLYEGDLDLSILNDVIEPVLHIMLEDYLLGVVPYEMSDSFPIEALKAQAIAARTYAIGKLKPKEKYDLVDTTNDQVYKGKNSEHTQAAQAIKETAGICGAYQGAFANCYYTASNGGQTELASHVWGGKNPGYIVMQDDPFDYQNSQSPIRKLVIPKNPGGEQQGLDGLRWVLAQAMGQTLDEKGYSNHWEHLRIDQVTGIQLETPMYQPPSRLYTELTLRFFYSAKTLLPLSGNINQGAKEQYKSHPGVVIQKLSANPNPLPTPFFAGPPIINGEDAGEIDFFQTPTPQAVSPEGNNSQQGFIEALTPVPTPAPTVDPYIHSPFVREEEEATVTLSLFPQTDVALGLSINQNGNELIELTESENAYTLLSRRFGHGVGMSQRGAEEMAKQGKTWQEILAFYYPGMDLIGLNPSSAQLPQIEQALLNTPGPLPTPTPRPTLMPVTQALEPGWKIARVENIEDHSYLNLRKEPGTASEVVGQLFKGQDLIVLPTQTQDGWYHVKTDVIEGYVAQEFVQLVEP